MGLFKRRFGNNKVNEWEEYARLTRAVFIPGTLTKSAKVITKHKTWEITLDKYTVSSQYSHQVFTRLTSYYRTTDNFTFKIFRYTPFHKLGKFFGMQDIEVGQPDIDNEFVIQGSDKSKLMVLFSDYDLREEVQLHSSINIRAKKGRGFFKRKIPEGIFSIVYQESGLIKDQEELSGLHKLMMLFLDQLYKIGSATKETPNIER
ncbi:MAG: hypothetical protein GY863_13420 [bacterium]|nr:hypothetical protein [bacterium]